MFTVVNIRLLQIIVSSGLRSFSAEKLMYNYWKQYQICVKRQGNGETSVRDRSGKEKVPRLAGIIFSMSYARLMSVRSKEEDVEQWYLQEEP